MRADRSPLTHRLSLYARLVDVVRERDAFAQRTRKQAERADSDKLAGLSGFAGHVKSAVTRSAFDPKGGQSRVSTSFLNWPQIRMRRCINLHPRGLQSIARVFEHER